jgi:hypothetical protein
MEPTRDEVDDATAQLVEHVVGLFSDSAHSRDGRDVTSERDYLDGTIEALVSERAMRQSAIDAVREALVRLESTHAVAAGVARRRLVTAVQHDEAINPIYRGLICEALGSMDDVEFANLALEQNMLHSVPVVYPRVEFERGRCAFRTTIMLYHLLSASAWAEYNSYKARASIPVPPSAIKPGLLDWMRARGVEELHVRADAYRGVGGAGGQVMWTRAEADEFERVTGRDAYVYRLDRICDAERKAECVEFIDLLSDDGERRGVLPYMRGVNEAALIEEFWRPIVVRNKGAMRAQIEYARIYTRKGTHQRARWGPPRSD